MTAAEPQWPEPPSHTTSVIKMPRVSVDRSDQHGSAVLVYDWDRGMLEVIFEAPPTAPEGHGHVARRVGGPVEGEGESGGPESSAELT